MRAEASALFVWTSIIIGGLLIVLGSYTTDIQITDTSKRVLYVPHTPIKILGDENFTQQNGVVSGNGTPSDPYVIEGWEIDANGGAYGIWIENTTSYFVIRNCRILNATDSNAEPYGTGIYINHCKNGTIYGCEIISTNYCAYFCKSSTLKIIGSSITSNNIFGFGCILYDSFNITISNNSIINNFCGIYLNNTSYAIINNNNISKNVVGIIMDYLCNKNKITENTISSNSNKGIDISHSSSYNTVTNNTITNNSGYGIDIGTSDCTHNRIFLNRFYYNNGAGDSFNSSHKQARDNGINNYWNSTSIGNYWHDWANNNNTNDQNGDSIVDWPYPIDGSSGVKDYYPLKSITSVNEISITWIIIFVAIVVIFAILSCKRK